VFSNRLIILAISFILSVVFFYLLNTFLKIFTEFHAVIAFVITLLLVILFKEPVRSLLKKIIGRQANRTLDQLETMNSELNKAIRYKEVTRILFNSFQTLFAGLPYAFYIVENDKFSIEDLQLVNDDELSNLDIDSKDINVIYNSKEQIHIKETKLPKKIKKKMLAAGLNTLFLFPGRVKLFAFLLIDNRKISFKKERDSMERFRSIQNKAGVILENTALFVDIEQKNTQVRKIIEISNQILSSFNIKDILDFILTTVKPIYKYDAAAIYLLDKSSKRLLRTSSQGYDSKLLEKLHLKVGQGSCGWVVQTGKIDVLNDVDGDEHYFKLREQTRSQVSIPLLHGEDVLGVVCLESNRLAFFNDSMVDNLQIFAQLAAIAIFNSLQLDDLLAKRALENDLIDAGIVQKKLLAQNFPNVEKLKIYAANLLTVMS